MFSTSFACVLARSVPSGWSASTAAIGFFDVEKAIPSVVVQATIDGGPSSKIKVSIDGKVVKTALDGKPIQTDPGLHKFRFETPGLAPIETPLVIQEGEHYKALPAEFVTHQVLGPGGPSAPVPTIRPIPSIVWILGAMTAAGAVGFTTFGLLGNAKKQSLENSGCAPFCSSSDAGVARLNYTVADLSLAVGVASLVAGGLFYVTRPSIPVQVAVAPSSSGFSFGAIGTF